MNRKVNYGLYEFVGFDILSDSLQLVPDASGDYIVVLRKGAHLPQISIAPVLTEFSGHDVIYVGQSKSSLQKRDICQHFSGNAGRSTLRKSLGALMGFPFVPRDARHIENGKTKFGDHDEAVLTSWMKENLLLYYCVTSDVDALEQQLIADFNPPLNLKDNSNETNAAYREALSRLRRQVVTTGDKSDTQQLAVSEVSPRKSHLYVPIWKKHLPEILALLEKGQGRLRMDKEEFTSVGNRRFFCFSLCIDEGNIPSLQGKAMARDFKMVMDESDAFKTLAKGRHFHVDFDKDFVLEIS